MKSPDELSTTSGDTILWRFGRPVAKVGVGQRADLDGAEADALGPNRIDAAKQPQYAEAGANPLFRMRPTGQHGEDQRLGVRPDVACLARMRSGVHSA